MNVPKKPKYTASFGEPEIRKSSVGEAEINTPQPQAPRVVEADPLDATAELNGGQPPAEEMPVNHRGDPVSAEQANPENGRVESSLVQPTDLLDMAGLARHLVGSIGEKAVQKFVTARAGAEGLTAIRHAQAAVKAGEMAPEGLADLAKRLMGKETPGLGYEPRPDWMVAAKKYHMDHSRVGPPLNEGMAPTVTGDFAGKPRTDVFANIPTNAGAHAAGRVQMTRPPENPVVKQFTDSAADWLANFSSQFLPPGVK